MTPPDIPPPGRRSASPYGLGYAATGRSGTINHTTTRREVGPHQASAVGPMQTAAPTAHKIATKLTDGDKSRQRFVQFHPSYQYEDFMQGFVPEQSGGFDLQPKFFLAMCDAADQRRDETFVLVIDELSRGDPGRVFGEALTYVEKSKRDLPFTLASGDSCKVPPNLVILATMNPFDRGVDEVDAAFERRFAKIAMDPDRDTLRNMLTTNGVPEYLRTRIVGFFDRANGLARTNPQGTIGHTYFSDVTDTASLQSVWDHQLRFLIEKAYRLDPETREELESGFEQLFDPEPEQPAGATDSTSDDTPDGSGGAKASEAPPPEAEQA